MLWLLLPLLPLLFILISLAVANRDELPQVRPDPAPSRPGLWLCSHRAKRWITFQHLFLKLTPRDPRWARQRPELFCQTDEAGLPYCTLGAGPRRVDGARRLVLAFNRPTDLHDPVSFEAPFQELSLEQENACLESLFAAVQAYPNDLTFAAWTHVTWNGYNCNSMVHSLARRAGLELPPFPKRFLLCPGLGAWVPGV